MKKLVLMAVAIVAVSFASCGNKQADAEKAAAGPIFKLLSGAGVSGQNHHMAIFDKWNEFELRPICRRKFPNTADKSQIGFAGEHCLRRQ